LGSSRSFSGGFVSSWEAAISFFTFAKKKSSNLTKDELPTHFCQVLFTYLFCEEKGLLELPESPALYLFMFTGKIRFPKTVEVSFAES